MTDKVKDMMNNPASMWMSMLGLLFMNGTGVFGNAQDNTHVREFAYQTEENHFKAIMDLRAKVEYLHGEVVALRKAKGSPVWPPGPPAASLLPFDVEWPPEEPDAGVAPDAAVEPDSTVEPEVVEPEPEKPAEAKPEEKKEIEWTEVQRPVKQED